MAVHLLFALALVAAVPGADRADPTHVGAQLLGGGAPNYIAPGARSLDVAGGLATSVHCTNVGISPAEITVTFREFDGTVACTLASIPVPAANTRTASTQNTAALLEDAFCASPPPLIGQGRAEIYVISGDPQRIVCGVQVLDPAAVTPAAMTTLDIYRNR